MIIEFLNKEIPLYGIFFWIGILVAGLIAIIIGKRNYLDSFDIISSAVYTMIMAIVGAKVLYLAISLPEVINFIKVYSDKLSALEIANILIKGGFVFYGGFIGGLLGLIIYAKQFKLLLRDYIGVYAVVLPLGHAFGRVGCFFGGCCYGIEYDGPCSHTYGELKYSSAPIDVPLFPVQLVEAACLFLLFIVLLIVFYKAKHRNSACVFTYALCYSVIRFVLEFFRGDVERGAIGPFSTSQIISIIIFMSAATALIVSKRKNRI